MKQVPKSCRVAISTGHTEYPLVPPYLPGAGVPEYPFSSDCLLKTANHAYEGVRNVLCSLGLDAERYGRKGWNPLGEIIRPGETVVLQPNFVRDFRETRAGHANCLMTHGSIIRAALDYVYLALGGKGRIIIADAPQNDGDFNTICRIAGLDDIQRFYRNHAGFEVEVYDLRPQRCRKVDGVIVAHEKLPGDPAGYVKVDLGRYSAFAEIEHLCHLLYGSEYDTSEIRHHHTGGVHEYLISGTVLSADCVINLPKLKTHKKTGITASMKNLVGINGNKNWLPHHREGTPAQGGDQFADDRAINRIELKVMALFRALFPMLGPLGKVAAGPLKALGKCIFGDTNAGKIRSGNWYGNDTTWRMVIDLNRILMYADKSGRVQEKPARRMFCIVDGIVAGEGNGPLDPTPKRAGTVVAGANPVAVDLVCARLMGFDHKQLPMLLGALEEHSLQLLAGDYEDIVCSSFDPKFDRALAELNGAGMAFKPHFGWQRHVALDS